MKPATILLLFAFNIATIFGNENYTTPDAPEEIYPDNTYDNASVPLGRAYSGATKTSSYDRGYDRNTLRDQLRAAGATAFSYYLEELGLGYILDSKGYYTLFAPTNHAIERLLKDPSCKYVKDDKGYYGMSYPEKDSSYSESRSYTSYSDILFPPHKQYSSSLRATFLHQIIIGNYYLYTLRESHGGLIPSLAGVPASIHVYGNTVVVNGGTIIKGDFHASNGIVHLVDYVHCLHMETVYEILKRSYDVTFEKCLEVMSLVNLIPLLTAGPPITVLVPSKSELETLINDIRYTYQKSQTDAAVKVIDFAKTRILSGYYYPENLLYLSSVKSLFGKQLQVFKKSDKEFIIGGHSVSFRRVELVTNGIVYFSDSINLGRQYGPGFGGAGFGYPGLGYPGFGYPGYGYPGYGNQFGYGGYNSYSPIITTNSNFACGFLCGVSIL